MNATHRDVGDAAVAMPVLLAGVCDQLSRSNVCRLIAGLTPDRQGFATSAAMLSVPGAPKACSRSSAS